MLILYSTAHEYQTTIALHLLFWAHLHVLDNLRRRPDVWTIAMRAAKLSHSTLEVLMLLIVLRRVVYATMMSALDCYCIIQPTPATINRTMIPWIDQLLINSLCKRLKYVLNLMGIIFKLCSKEYILHNAENYILNIALRLPGIPDIFGSAREPAHPG